MMKTKLCAILIAAFVFCLGYSSQAFAQRGNPRDLLRSDQSKPESNQPSLPEAPNQASQSDGSSGHKWFMANRVDKGSNETVKRFRTTPNAPPPAHAPKIEVTENGHTNYALAACAVAPGGYPPDLPYVYKKEYMPVNLPGWGKVGDSYPELEDKKLWTVNTYLIEPGDVILAVNDREVFNTYEMQNIAAPAAGRYAVLVVYDTKRDGIYCVAVRVIHGKIWIKTHDTVNGPAVSWFETQVPVWVYKPTYPKNGWWPPVH